MAQDGGPPGRAHDLDGQLPAELEPGSAPLVLLRTSGTPIGEPRRPR
ncbi:hypothetical protein [Micromonospora sp. IBHARD004]